MSEPYTELLEPFSEENCNAWAELIWKLLAEDTPLEVHMLYLHEWETKAQAQFLRAISTVQSLRSTNRDLLAALERLLAGLWCLGETEVSIEFAEAVIEAKALVAKAKLPA